MHLDGGAMSVYSSELKSNFMSWFLSILTVSIFITSDLIVLLRCMQWLLPGSKPRVVVLRRLP